MMVEINAHAGAKLYGVNIVPPPHREWDDLHAEWPWSAWVKPQIDAAVRDGIGCNCIRMIGDLSGVFTRRFTQATYNQHWIQLVSYCADLGAYVIVGGGAESQAAGMTNKDIEANVGSLLAALSNFNNIAYVDVMQEQNAWRDSDAAARTNAIYAALKPKTTRLLTFSTTQKITENDSSGWMASVAASCDVLDFHIYKMIGYNAMVPLVAGHLDRWQSTYPTKPIAFGEVGSPQSDGEEENRTFVGNVFRLVAKDARLRGCCLWAAQDQSTVPESKYGLYDADWNLRYALRGAIRQVTGGSVVRPH
jgi:hypothetical protein